MTRTLFWILLQMLTSWLSSFSGTFSTISNTPIIYWDVYLKGGIATLTVPVISYSYFTSEQLVSSLQMATSSTPPYPHSTSSLNFETIPNTPTICQLLLLNVTPTHQPLNFKLWHLNPAIQTLPPIFKIYLAYMPTPRHRKTPLLVSSFILLKFTLIINSSHSEMIFTVESSLHFGSPTLEPSLNPVSDHHPPAHLSPSLWPSLQCICCLIIHHYPINST